MITRRAMHEWNTNLRIVTLEENGKPRIMIRETCGGEPTSTLLGAGAKNNRRIIPAHPGLDFEATIRYWTLALEGKATIIPEPLAV